MTRNVPDREIRKEFVRELGRMGTAAEIVEAVTDDYLRPSSPEAIALQQAVAMLTHLGDTLFLLVDGGE